MTSYAPAKDLHLLPKIRDSLSYLYVEHCRIDQEDRAIAVHDATGRVAIPSASLTVLLLGPGTTVTHAAVRTLADSGCLVIWTGEEGVRFYAQGMGETRSARNLLRQARRVSDPASRLRVVRRMYEMRFNEPLADGLTIEQIRGKEGIRVREAYAEASRATGVAWTGRSYRRDGWAKADPINRALSAANSNLYGICHAAIVSAGYSPALGFIHTGKMLSFVYDIADLYKTELTIPVAFEVVVGGAHDLERRARILCREIFHQGRLLQRIVPDIEAALGLDDADVDSDYDLDEALPGGLWDPEAGQVEGGLNRADRIHDGEPPNPSAGGGTLNPSRPAGGGEQRRSTELIGLAEIARRSGAKIGTVRTWRRRHTRTFPAPAATLPTGPAWHWSDVERWLALDRRPGRPMKSRTPGQSELLGPE